MMEKKKIFIVEDDPIIASDLEGILTDLGYEVCGNTHLPLEAKKKITQLQPDLVLLDINLEAEMDGVELAMLLKPLGFNFIFITAFTDKATLDRVKPTHPLGYIIKPFEEKEIAVTLELAFNKIPEEKSVSSINSGSDSVFIKTGNNTSVKINFNDILLMEACDNYAYIHTAKERIIVSFTLKDLENKIAASFLLRVHRSYIINLNKVEAIRQQSFIIGKHEIPLGKSYRDEVLKHFPTL